VPIHDVLPVSIVQRRISAQHFRMVNQDRRGPLALPDAGPGPWRWAEPTEPTGPTLGLRPGRIPPSLRRRPGVRRAGSSGFSAPPAQRCAVSARAGRWSARVSGSP
jgi:hypothetical protein